MTEAKSRLPLAIGLRAVPLLCKRHHVNSSCTTHTGCQNSSRKAITVAIKLVNTLVYKAKVAALRGIPLVQDERELPAHAAGARS